MNPIVVKNEIEDALSKQLRFMYPIDNVCPDSSIVSEIKRLFPVGDEDKTQRHEFVNSAYVEAIPQYKPGRTLQELVEANELHDSTAKTLVRYFAPGSDMSQIRLHEHQENSLVSVNRGENLLVCTGTGSGKTESFLIPVLDSIARERIEQGENYESGVRAMILYPMNALVNDQVLRIRNILKEAQGIDGIQDITYGIYTGDVATEESERNLRELDENKMDAIREIETVNAKHPYFSDDVVPRTEYTRRSRWNSLQDGGDGPADILITNYAMLERLMLNPKSSGLFSNTWKFVILDEAHTYDGSMGTEISWLLKRLSYRVGGAESLQYLATSATLIEAEEEENPDEIRQEIYNCFASKIFPQNNRAFAIELGNPQWTEAPPGLDAGKYTEILSKPGIDIADNAAQLPECLQPKANATLFEQYIWLKDVKQRMKRYAYLREENITHTMAFGDVVCVSDILSDFERTLTIQISADSIVSLLSCFGATPADVRNNVNKFLPQNLRNGVIGFLRGRDAQLSVEVQHISKIALAVMSIVDGYDLSEMDFNPADLPFQILDVNSIINYSHACSTWCELLNNIETQLLSAWRDETGLNEAGSVEEVFTQYIRKHGELYRLINEMKAKSHVEYESLACVTMGERNNINSEFDAFCQLLALSISNVARNKPLVDLRFHQTVQGVHGMMVRFSQKNEEVYTELLPNVDGIQTGDGERIYKMGCCLHCGQPYILAYTNVHEVPQNGCALLANYKDSNYSRLWALACWIPSAHAEDDVPERVQTNYWLEYMTGKLHRSNNHPNPEAINDFIKVCYVAKAGRGAQNTDHICTCPSCGDTMTIGGDFALIAPYKLSDDQARCFILRTLAQNADPDTVPAGKPAEGRKVLAFSDSRAMSARVPMTFDEIMGAKLLDYVVYESIRQQQGVVSFCPGGGDGSIVDNVKELLNERQADSLLNRKYKDGNVVQAFSQNDVASQLILETVRTTSSRGLVGRKYIDVCSYAHLNREENENVQAAWKDFVEFCDNNENLAEKLFLVTYRYLVKKGRLTCEHLNQAVGRYYELDFRQFNPQEQRNDYRLGLDIVREGNANEGITFLANANRASSRFEKWIKQYAGNVTLACRDVVENLLVYLETSNILLPVPDNPDRFNLNAADIRLKLGENDRVDLMFDGDYFFRIEEHSGQISKELARLHQRYFSNGEINILSCSTTFEMGVDLGNLNNVFLCNLPPTVANYRQRAGRAGRRAGASAYVLTYMGHDSAHDSNFSNNPAAFLFQKVTPPVIYNGILSYSAKHMRAEALSHFLAWCSNGNPQFRWKRCQSFFGDAGNNNAQGVVTRIEDWYRECAESVWQSCNEIAGVQIDYNPAADLCFQLVGNHQQELAGKSLIELAGPCLSGAVNGEWNYWKSPAFKRYGVKCAKLSEEGLHRAVTRMGREDLASYLASIRVLPRYGFPCDTVQLMVADNNVKLSRDRLLAMREYAPGCTVFANKNYYTSLYPKAVGTIPQNPVNAEPIRVFRCAECEEFFVKYDVGNVVCPKCQTPHDGQALNLIVPDFFKGEWDKDRRYNPQVVNECYGGGQNDPINVEQTNLAVSTSDTREILYVNLKNIRNRRYFGAQVDGLMHALRTDIVIWKLINIPDGVRDKLKNYDAWMSALQAILKSASKVLKVHSKDISGLISQDTDGLYMMVIYDSSTSGAGSVLKLMPGNRQEGIEVEIIKTALDLCVNGDCSCGKLPPEEGSKTVVRDVVLYNGADIKTSRLAKACYKCLLSYSNRRHHSMLDTYDASVILKAMLGPNASGIDDDRPSNHNGATGGERNSKADATTGADNAGDRSETEQGRDASSNEAIHFPVGKPVSEGTPQRFISIETNKSLCKKLKTKRNEYFYVLVNGKVIKDKLTSVLQGKRAVFEKSDVVSYSNIMEIK